MLRNLLILCFLLIMPVMPAQAAKSVYCTNCSTILIQKLEQGLAQSQLGRLVAQYKEAVKQTALQIQMVKTEIDQYLALMQGLAQLPQELIGEVAGMFSDLATLTNELNTLRGDLTSLGQIFNDLYPNLDSFKDLARNPSAASSAQYQQHQDTWSKETDRAAQATFQLSGSQLQALQSDSTRFQAYINKLLSTPEGQQQALMAGNQLTALQINETRQLRELIATNIQSDLAAMEKAEKEGQMSREVWRNWMEGMDRKAN